MRKTAQEISEEMGKLDGLSISEKETLYQTIGLGALKYYILKVDPKKRILFDPKESVDFNGNTGPFIQYAHARIKSLLGKETERVFSYSSNFQLELVEKSILKHLFIFPEIILQAGQIKSPALIANYIYDLVKSFNTFYQNVPVLSVKNADQKEFRMRLCEKVAEVIDNACSLLGIDVPHRM